MSLLELFDLPKDEREKSSFEKLPAGEYQVEIEAASIDEANQYGPQLKYTLRVTDNSFRNRKLWVNRKLDAANLWKIRKDLDALGMKDVSSKNVITTLEKITGKQSNITLTYRPNPKNSEKPFANIDFISQASEPQEVDGFNF